MVLTKLPFLIVLPQPAMMMGATESPFLSQHHVGIPLPCALGFPSARVPSLQQMLPNISVLCSLVTRSVPEVPLCCEVTQDIFWYLKKLISTAPLQEEFAWELSGLVSVSPWH